MLFDTHAHYDDARFDADRDALLASLPPAGAAWS
jgi:TatD DNase family protein